MKEFRGGLTMGLIASESVKPASARGSSQNDVTSSIDENVKGDSKIHQMKYLQRHSKTLQPKNPTVDNDNYHTRPMVFHFYPIEMKKTIDDMKKHSGNEKHVLNLTSIVRDTSDELLKSLFKKFISTKRSTTRSLSSALSLDDILIEIKPSDTIGSKEVKIDEKKHKSVANREQNILKDYVVVDKEDKLFK